MKCCLLVLEVGFLVTRLLQLVTQGQLVEICSLGAGKDHRIPVLKVLLWHQSEQFWALSLFVCSASQSDCFENWSSQLRQAARHSQHQRVGNWFLPLTRSCVRVKVAAWSLVGLEIQTGAQESMDSHKTFLRASHFCFRRWASSLLGLSELDVQGLGRRHSPLCKAVYYCQDLDTSKHCPACHLENSKFIALNFVR